MKIINKALNYLFNTRDGLILVGGAAALGGAVAGAKIAQKYNQKQRKLYLNAVKDGMLLRANGYTEDDIEALVVEGEDGKYHIRTVGLLKLKTVDGNDVKPAEPCSDDVTA